MPSKCSSIISSRRSSWDASTRSGKSIFEEVGYESLGTTQNLYVIHHLSQEVVGCGTDLRRSARRVTGYPAIVLEDDPSVIQSDYSDVIRNANKCIKMVESMRSFDFSACK
jgi:hypothetical protein